jgi:isopenicillin-N N-acyltransferase-like protein
MRVLEFSGSPKRIGEAFGESCREEIAELYAIRLANALREARTYGRPGASEADLLALAAACLLEVERFHPAGAAELSGIARGARLSAARLLAMNGLTDLRDTLAWGAPPAVSGACTAALVAGERSTDGRARLAQNWDLATDNGRFVLAVHRRPDPGPETWSVTTVGCLSLIGINEHGLAVGTTNLRTRDARLGVPYLSLLHRALESDSAPEAADWIARARRAGAHSYLLADARERVIALECSAGRAQLLELRDGVHVQCNHCLAPENRALESDTPMRSSHARHARMGALLGTHGPLGSEDLQRFLADTEGGTLAICRDDFEGISTNASTVLTPSAFEFLACAGLPSGGREGRGGWVSLLAGR